MALYYHICDENSNIGDAYCSLLYSKKDLFFLKGLRHQYSVLLFLSFMSTSNDCYDVIMM